MRCGFGSLTSTKSRLHGVDTVPVLLFSYFSRTFPCLGPAALNHARLNLIRSVETIESGFAYPQLHTQITQLWSWKADTPNKYKHKRYVSASFDTISTKHHHRQDRPWHQTIHPMDSTCLAPILAAKHPLMLSPRFCCGCNHAICQNSRAWHLPKYIADLQTHPIHFAMQVTLVLLQSVSSAKKRKQTRSMFLVLETQ